MRRENSVFNAAFISHEGDKLHNNDYYGCAELDRFACYVVADGVNATDVESESAKIAVQAAIAAFHERPSIKKRTLRKYIAAAHNALKENNRRQSLRASITVVVTDYQKIRYAWVGNSRFFLYRSGRMINESLDHSLSMQMVKRNQLPVDKVAEHEERNNLARYAGQPDSLRAQVSKKLKLVNGDVFALFTRGVWERCNSGEIQSALADAENDPMQALEDIEARMFESSLDDIDNYTAALVLVDKIYVDPNKGKKLKKILLIVIPIAIILIVVLVILLVIRHNNETRRRAMNTAFDSAVVYIDNDSHLRAIEELTTAIGLAGELRDDDFRERAETWRAVVDAIDGADRQFEAGNFTEAQNQYRSALYLSRYANNAGRAYIERRMAETERFVTVRGLIALGDTLVSIGDLEAAEIRYQDAWRMAASIGDIDGREMAISALQNLYSILDREETRQAREDERRMIEDALIADIAAREEESIARAATRRAEDYQEAVEMEAMGDRAVAIRDYINAELFYTIARERFASLGDTDAVRRIESKQRSLSDNVIQAESQRVIAALYIEEGDRLFDNGHFTEARERFVLARNIYTRLNDDIAIASVLARINASDAQISRMRAESEAQQREAREEAERRAERESEEAQRENEDVAPQESAYLEESNEVPSAETANNTTISQSTTSNGYLVSNAEIDQETTASGDTVGSATLRQDIAPTGELSNATTSQEAAPATSTTDNASERRNLEQERGNATTNPPTPGFVLAQVEDISEQAGQESNTIKALENHATQRRNLTESRESNFATAS